MKNNNINKRIKDSQDFDKTLITFAQVIFILTILLGIVLIVSSCSSNDKVGTTILCNNNCGKLITKFHYRDKQTIDYTYVTNCNDTLISTVILNKEQLGIDNGISYFINTYSLKDYYCKP